MRVLFTLLLFWFCTVTGAQDLYFPPLTGDAWETRSPESLNWCAEEVTNLLNYLEAENTKSFIVLKDGRIVLEAYFGTYTQDSLWVWYSAGKSLTAVLAGIAQQEGHLSIEDRTADYLGTGWTSLDTAKENLITVRHQLTMTTGLDESEFFCTLPECLTYTADAGTRWAYHNSPYSLLRDVIENATDENYNTFTTTRVKWKTGMDGFWLPVGYNNFYFSTARSMARFGLLILNGGVWDETPVLDDPAYVQAMVNTSQDLNPSYGYLWWLNGKASYIPPGIPLTIPGPIAPDAPADVYTAAGAQGQFISVSPGLGLVMVRQGLDSGSDPVPIALHNEIWRRLMLAVDCGANPVRELVSGEGISVYPNPVSDILRVNLVETPVRITVLDQDGRLVREISHSREIDVSGLPTGVYTLSIKLKNKVRYGRFVRW